MELRRGTAACCAAACPREALSSHALMTVGEPQHVGKGSAHDHLACVGRKTTRVEQGAILFHHRLDLLQIRVRPEDNFDKRDRKSTRLNSSHSQISYAVFCLKKKKKKRNETSLLDRLTTDWHLEIVHCDIGCVS